MRATPLAVFLLLTLGGCAAERWENPNVPEVDWADDQQDCQEVAEGTGEREYDIDEQESPELSLDYNQPIEEYDEQMNQGFAEGLAQRTFRSCMLQKGYVLMRDKGP
jgi:hypothetical protein